MPDARSLDGDGLRLWWLPEHFRDGPPSDATNHVIGQYALSYSFPLIGSVLFSHKSMVDVRLFIFPLLQDLEEVGTLSGAASFLACLIKPCNPTNQFVLQPYSDRILRDYPLAL